MTKPERDDDSELGMNIGAAWQAVELFGKRMNPSWLDLDGKPANQFSLNVSRRAFLGNGNSLSALQTRCCDAVTRSCQARESRFTFPPIVGRSGDRPATC